MASEEDALVLAARAAELVTWADSIAPLVFIARTKDELMLDWDQARALDAQPTAIAAALMITALTIHTTPQDSLHGQLSDALAYSKTVSDAIETYIVNDDFIAGSLEGIEVCLLFQRLHFAYARFQKVWLSLRRTIGLAEIIGLPRASFDSSARGPGKSGCTRNGQTREEAGALLWQSACTMGKLAGCMFGLPITARIDPIPIDRPVFVDQEFRELVSLAPSPWWNAPPHPEAITLDLVLQYFHQYFTARAHLLLALNTDGNNIDAYSYMICTEACRDLAVRYTILRPLVLGGFFPVKLFDVQALTAAIFLLHTCHRPGSSYRFAAAQSPSSQDSIQRILISMDSASQGFAGQFTQEAARTIRSLAALLSNSFVTDSRYVDLRVPLLEPHTQYQQRRMTQTAGAMEISEVLPFLTNDAYDPDQWLMLGDFDTGGFEQV
ncbi:hypothetical protein LTR22_026123 [Elasticomyces elasticus]|nr:hypothetical protein LTR22_026123 [Elasticomyces elasticus]